MRVGFLKPVLCSIFLGLVSAIISTTPAHANEAETYISNEVRVGSRSVPFVTTANLRLRTRPCTREGLIQRVVAPGQTVQVLDFRDGEWYAVEVDGNSGYMHSGFLVESNRTYETPAAYEPAPAVEEGTWSESYVTTMEEVSTGPAWSMTTVEVTGSPVSNETTAEVTRSLASNETTIEVIEPVSHVTTLEEVSTGPAWYVTTVEVSRLESDETNEAVAESESYETIEAAAEPVSYETIEEATESVSYETIEEVTEPMSYVTTANLMFRSEPCADNGYVQAIVPIGETVQVTDFLCGEWFEVEMNGTSGYMHSSFLINENEWVDEPEMDEPAPVIERIHWSEARNIVPTWEPVTITDVRTGISFQIISFSHGNHADVEPATAEDTATLLSIYGGAWSWNTRPVLVHVGDRTFAASINGMPHDVSPVQGNNFNGHICLYFYGSSRHTGSLAHDRDHHNSIWEAYRSGH